MIIHSMTLENFRSFYGTHVINFSIDRQRNTTFIWGDNNAGKTNLLNAITWCLHEQFTSSFKREDDLLNHQAKNKGITSYSVSIKFEESGILYEIKRAKGSDEGLFLHRIVGGDYQSIENVSLFINSIIPREMMQYFIIDGEGISSSVDSKGQINAARSIKDILGFQVAEKTLEDLKVIKKEHEISLAGINISDKLTKSQNRIITINEKLDLLFKEKADYDEALAIYYDKINKAEDYLKASNHEVVKLKIKHREELRHDIAALKERLISIESDKIRIIRSYAYSTFSNAIDSNALDFLVDTDQVLKYSVDKELINQIIADEQCICGSEVKQDSSILESFKKLLKNVSSADVTWRTNKAKSKLSSIRREEENALLAIGRVLSDTQKTKDSISHKESSLKNISIEIESVENETISSYEKELNRNQKAITTTQRDIGAKEAEIKKLTEEKKQLDSEVSRLSAFTPEANKIKRKIDFINEIQAVIEQELELAFKNIKEQLILRMNQFMHANLAQDLIVKITDDNKIGLYNKNHTLTAPGGGLTAMLSLVFISTLISIARIRKNARGNILTPGAIAPIILDAPFSKLSETYAPGLAAALPALSEQLIIFMYEGNAKGGEIIMRNSQHVGKEYYLLQKIRGSKGAEVSVSHLTVGDKKYALTAYEQDVDTVEIKEVD